MKTGTFCLAQCEYKKRKKVVLMLDSTLLRILFTFRQQWNVRRNTFIFFFFPFHICQLKALFRIMQPISLLNGYNIRNNFNFSLDELSKAYVNRPLISTSWNKLRQKTFILLLDFTLKCTIETVLHLRSDVH